MTDVVELLNSVPYVVYGSNEDANEYLFATLGAAGDAWRAADEDTQKRAQISATRWFNDLPWLGEKTAEGQPNAWPRDDMLDVTDGTTPDAVTNAYYELSALLVEDNDLRATLADPHLHSITAGSVSLSYFRGQNSTGLLTPMPKVVMDLVGKWITGGSQSNPSGGPVTSGVDACTPFDRRYVYGRGSM